MKAYILIRALVKTDISNGVNLDDTAQVLRDEVHSDLESIGQDVLMVTTSAPPRDALEKLGDNRDAYTLDFADRIIDGRELMNPTRGILRAVGEDRDYWVRRFTDLHEDIAKWQLAGLTSAVNVLAAPDSVGVMRAFTLHHEALLAVLAKHGLMGMKPAPATSPALVASLPDPRD